MADIEIIEKIQEIASYIFEVAPETIQLTSKQEDIPEWDSLGHLRLIMSLEEIFLVKFPMDIIPTYKSVEALVTEIKKQIN